MATTMTFLRPPFYRQMNPSAAKRKSVWLDSTSDSDYFRFHIKVDTCIHYAVNILILFFTLVVISYTLKYDNIDHNKEMDRLLRSTKKV